MSQILKILLQQQQQLQKSCSQQQWQIRQIGVVDDDSNSLIKQVTRLVYKLLSMQKVQLLRSIFTNLKKQQQITMSKQQQGKVAITGKSNDSNKNKEDKQTISFPTRNTTTISYSQLIISLRLEVLLMQLQNSTTINKNLMNNENVNKLMVIINFFIDYVFSQRRITSQQITVLQQTIKQIFQQQQQEQQKQKQQMLIIKSIDNKNNQNKQLINKFINKCQLVIRLAKQQQTIMHEEKQQKADNNQQIQTAIQYINNIKQINKQYQQQQQQKIKQQLISTIFVEQQYYLNNDDKITQTLLGLYQHYHNTIIQQQQQQQSFSNNKQPLTIKNNLNTLLPSLIFLTQLYSMQVLNQQVNQLVQFITKQQQQQNKDNNQQTTTKQPLLTQVNKHWLTILFVQQTIKYFNYVYQQQISKRYHHHLNHKQQQQQQSQQLNNNTLHSLQSILLTISQLYLTLLQYIISSTLQQGLQNDLKNNYYLSQNKLIYHVANLSSMAYNWLQPSNNDNNNKLLLLSKPLACQQFITTKLIYINQQFRTIKANNNNSQQLQTIFNQINTKLLKILEFIWTEGQRQKIQSRILSMKEYKQKKVQNKIEQLLGHNQKDNNNEGKDNLNLIFMRWFVYDYNDQQPQQQQQQKQSSQIITTTTPSYNPILQTTSTKLYNKLSSPIVLKHALQSTTHVLIRMILSLPQKCIKSVSKSASPLFGQQINPNFLEQTYEFYSPTYNNQYLYFSYIYGQMKDVYFYHNHHYSHCLLIVYQALIQELTKKLVQDNLYNDQSNTKDNTNNANDNNTNTQQQTNSYHTRQLHRQQYNRYELTQEIFNKLRNQLGKYAKDHLLQPNSKQFYEYLNLFKFTYITLNKVILQEVEFDQLVLLFDLLLNEIIVKENHPLIRQYIEVIMARVYFTIKQISIKSNKNNNNNNNLAQRFYDCRNRMINMLQYDQQNIHNLNIGVPILMILGYQMISYMQEHPQQLHLKREENEQQVQVKSNTKQQMEIQNQQSGQKQIKPLHQMDIHYILVKYISCHVAYMRTICQYYISVYVKLMKQNKNNNNQDKLLQNLVSFWHSDKDSVKIMANIQIAIQGFKSQMKIFNQNISINNNFYLCFERVEEQPSIQAQYFLINDAITIIDKLANSSDLSIYYEIKIMFAQKILALKQQANQLKSKMIESLKATNSQIKTHKSEPINKKTQKTTQSVKRIKPTKQQKRRENKLLLKQKLQHKQNLLLKKQQKKQLPINNDQLLKEKLKQNLNKSYCQYQKINEPKVIIIATLLQKVHNFGYLVRTLTGHNAMLAVPSGQPFTHPECKELLPKQEDIDVKVVEVKQRNLEGFIKMYQQRGYPLIALEQCSKSITLQKTVFPQKYMLLLGNQRIGAPASLLNMADILVQIPQIGKVRSLNVHVSMVICFWEYLKQQQQKKKTCLKNE